MIKRHEVQYFIELQERTFEIFKYVACHETNFATYSTKIESVLIDICCFFDSLCQNFIRDRALNGFEFVNAGEIKEFNKKVAAKSDFTISDYQKLLDTDLSLHGKELLIKAYQAEWPFPEVAKDYHISPFGDWVNGRQLQWWKAFTSLKHNRITNFKEANLRNTIFSLGAVFILLSLKYEESFKNGQLGRDFSSIFSPTYWNVRGMVTIGTQLWR